METTIWGLGFRISVYERDCLVWWKFAKEFAPFGEAALETPICGLFKVNALNPESIHISSVF